MLPGFRQWDLSLKEEFKTTNFSLLSINPVTWAKEKHYRQLKPGQDHVVAERHEPDLGYVFPRPLLGPDW